MITKVCLRFAARLFTSKNCLTSRYVVSADEANMRLLMFKICEIGVIYYERYGFVSRCGRLFLCLEQGCLVLLGGSVYGGFH